MNFTDITTWSVSKGMATPKNPYFCTEGYYVACINLPEGQNCEGCNNYLKFEKFAQQHTYATNAPDGSYSTDCFGKIVWQYKDWITEKQDFNEWIDVTDNFADSITVKNNWPSEKRRFLPFIQAL